MGRFTDPVDDRRKEKNTKDLRTALQMLVYSVENRDMVSPGEFDMTLRNAKETLEKTK
jgi:hypothetical protein